jgi:hypothetical protein
MLERIKDVKTSVPGLVCALLMICSVLEKQGITLGHAGTGSVVGLIAALGAGALGLYSKSN